MASTSETGQAKKIFKHPRHNSFCCWLRRNLQPLKICIEVTTIQFSHYTFTNKAGRCYIKKHTLQQ